MTLGAKILFILGICIFLDGLTYFFSLPNSKYRAWLLKRRNRWWMRMWPPAQWALNSEQKRLLIGTVQSFFGVLLILLALFKWR